MGYAVPPEGDITIPRTEYLALYVEIANLRLAVETVGSGLGGLLERGIIPPAAYRQRIVELWCIANEHRKPLASGVEVAAVVENTFARRGM
jgi:hypothetical protein